MNGLEIDVNYGETRAIDLASLILGTSVISGPASLMGWSVRDAGLENNQQAFGSVVAPAAGQVIAQLPAIQQADYDIRWQVQLLGPAAAADQNNFGFFEGAVQVLTSQNAGAAGVYPQTQLAFYDGFGQAFAIKAIGAGAAGVTYTAQLTIVPEPIAGPVLQLQDGKNEIAEVFSPIFGADTRWFGPSGVKITGTLRTIVNVGTLAGALYIRYDKD